MGRAVLVLSFTNPNDFIRDESKLALDSMNDFIWSGSISDPDPNPPPILANGIITIIEMSLF